MKKFVKKCRKKVIVFNAVYMTIAYAICIIGFIGLYLAGVIVIGMFTYGLF